VVGCARHTGPCDACALRSFALAAAGMRAPEMCQCVAGAEDTADSNCSLCAAGSFQPCDLSHKREHAAKYSDACEALVVGLGERNAASAMRCELCTANFYSEAPGADSCSACPANASSPAGSEARREGLEERGALALPLQRGVYRRGRQRVRHVPARLLLQRQPDAPVSLVQQLARRLGQRR